MGVGGCGEEFSIISGLDNNNNISWWKGGGKESGG